MKLTETDLEKAIQKAAQKAIDEAFGMMRSKIERAETIDKIIEDVIPRQYSGLARDRMKNLIRKKLNERRNLK